MDGVSEGDEDRDGVLDGIPDALGGWLDSVGSIDVEGGDEMLGFRDGEYEGAAESLGDSVRLSVGTTERLGLAEGTSEMEGDGLGALDVDGALDGRSESDGALEGWSEPEGLDDGCNELDGLVDGGCDVDGDTLGASEAVGLPDGENDMDGLLDGIPETLGGWLESVGSEEEEGRDDALGFRDGECEGAAEMLGDSVGLSDGATETLARKPLSCVSRASALPRVSQLSREIARAAATAVPTATMHA